VHCFDWVPIMVLPVDSCFNHVGQWKPTERFGLVNNRRRQHFIKNYNVFAMI
jgi:hypothetical protein